MTAIWLDLEWSGCLILECHLESEPFNMRTTYNNSKSKHVWYSSPFCNFFINTTQINCSTVSMWDTGLLFYWNERVFNCPSSYPNLLQIEHQQEVDLLLLCHHRRCLPHRLDVDQGSISTIFHPYPGSNFLCIVLKNSSTLCSEDSNTGKFAIQIPDTRPDNVDFWSNFWAIAWKPDYCVWYPIGIWKPEHFVWNLSGQTNGLNTR